MIENIYLRNIQVGQVGQAAIRINQNYGSKEQGEGGHYTLFKNIYVEKMTCNQSPFAIQLLGNENLPIENIHIIDCTFENVENENKVDWVNGFNLENVKINGQLATVLK